MMNRSDIQAFARRVFQNEKRPKNPQLMHPNREWVIGLLVAIILFAAPAFWSARTYLEYREVSVEAVQPEEDGIVVYRESLVEAALTIFSEKEVVVEEILSNVVFTVPEPEPDEENETSTTTESEGTSPERADIPDEGNASSSPSANATSTEAIE